MMDRFADWILFLEGGPRSLIVFCSSVKPTFRATAQYLQITMCPRWLLGNTSNITHVNAYRSLSLCTAGPTCFAQVLCVWSNAQVSQRHISFDSHAELAANSLLPLLLLPQREQKFRDAISSAPNNTNCSRLWRISYGIWHTLDFKQNY